jgi:LSD1 subclass zinc finger protein
MNLYLIIKCSSCGNVLLAKRGQKTKYCFFCNTKLKMSRVRILAEAPTSFKASQIARIIKNKLKNNHISKIHSE